MAQMTMGGRDTFHSKDSRSTTLLMSSPHAQHRVHSLLDNNSWLRNDCYRHAVWISVSDAKMRGFIDGDLVRVYNDIAEMILPAYVTSRVVPGTNLHISRCLVQPSETPKSQLMPDGVDMGGAPNFLTHNEDLPQTIVGFLAL